MPHVRLHRVLRFRRADLEQWLHDHTVGISNAGRPRPVASVKPPSSLSRGMLRKTGERVLRRFHREAPGGRRSLGPPAKRPAPDG